MSELQQAADAAALAGTVWMPNLQKATAAGADVLAANDIANGANDVTVVMREGATPTSLRVEITDHSATRFFSAVFMDGDQALTRTAEAEYFLPLPLGSPLNYFGGDHAKTVQPDVSTTTVTWPVPHNSLTRPPSGPFGCNVGTTSAEGLGYWAKATSYNSTGFSGTVRCGWTATTSSTSSAPTTQVPSNVPCNRLQSPTSEMGRWNSGVLGALPTYTAGSRHTGTVASGNRQCLWAVLDSQPPDHASRTPVNAPCNVTGDLLHGSWNNVVGVVTYLPLALLPAPLCQWTASITTVVTPGAVPIPADRSPGFWAQVEGPGTVAAYGDAFSTRCTTALNCATKQSNQWRESGYWYVIKVPEQGAAPFTISVFDALFRRDGVITAETGDYNLGAASTSTNPDFTTEYRVYRQTHPMDIAQREPVESAVVADQAENSCWWSVTAQVTFDMQWRPLCSIVPSPGETYLLNVRSYSPGPVQGAGLNGYAVQAVASASTVQPALYAYSDMGMFNNGTGTFYLAEVAPSFAGKVLAVDLWDPGDVAAGAATIYPKMPSASAPKPVRDAPATCTYTSSPDPNAVNVTSSAWLSTGIRYATAQASDNETRCAIDTAPSGSANRFNDEWLRIRIQIPADYTCTVGLNPETQAGSCWWGIQYSFTDTPYDVTTWKARIEGNPVHLTA